MKKNLKNIFYICEGYLTWAWNIITFKTYKKSLIRLSICNKCQNNINGICELCGCILNAKTRVNYPEDENGISIDGCPLKKW